MGQVSTNMTNRKLFWHYTRLAHLTQADSYEYKAEAEEADGDVESAGFYRKLASNYRNMARDCEASEKQLEERAV